MNHRILAFLTAILVILTCAVSVSAEGFDPEQKGSVSVTLTDLYHKTPVSGAELSLYYVATVGINTDGKLNYIYTEDFSSAGISIDDPDLSSKLDAYLSKMQVEAIKLKTDGEGKACYTDLPPGLYLIRQTGAVEGFAPCTPFLVTVPAANGEEYQYHVNATPKTEVAKLTSVTIRKAWNTDGGKSGADRVTVQLLRNGSVVETAVLSEENNWQVTYTDMPESDAYSVREKNVPEGFTATYQRSGYVFTVTNTPTLAQTGQLFWPLPVLAISGMLLILIGCALLSKKEKKDA